MCEVCFDLRWKGSTVHTDKRTLIYPTSHSTAPTTLPLLALLIPRKTCILFALLYQNTQALRWKITMNTSRPNPNTQYHPLHTVLNKTSRRTYTHIFTSRPHHTTQLQHLPIPTNPQPSPRPSSRYTWLIAIHDTLSLRLVHLHYLRNVLHIPCHTHLLDPIMYHYLYLTY